MTRIDYSDLGQILEARRQKTLRDLTQRLREAREEWTRTTEVRDTADSSELEGREDIELGLIQMKADTLKRINEALMRWRRGTYGSCVDCRRRIAVRRLRALPFAARCRECEEACERADQSARRAGAALRHSAPGVEMRDW